MEPVESVFLPIEEDLELSINLLSSLFPSASGEVICLQKDGTWNQKKLQKTDDVFSVPKDSTLIIMLTKGLQNVRFLFIVRSGPREIYEERFNWK